MVRGQREMYSRTATEHEQLFAQRGAELGQRVVDASGAGARGAGDQVLFFQCPKGSGEHPAADSLDGAVEFVEAIAPLGEQPDDDRAPLVAGPPQQRGDRARLALLGGDDPVAPFSGHECAFFRARLDRLMLIACTTLSTWAGCP